MSVRELWRELEGYDDDEEVIVMLDDVPYRVAEVDGEPGVMRLVAVAVQQT